MASRNGTIIAEVPVCCASGQDIIGIPARHMDSAGSAYVMPVDASSVSLLLRNPDVNIAYNKEDNTFITRLSGFGYPQERSTTSSIHIRCIKRKDRRTFKAAHRVLSSIPNLPIKEDERTILQAHAANLHCQRMERHRVGLLRRQANMRKRKEATYSSENNNTPNNIPFVTEIVLPFTTKQ